MERIDFADGEQKVIELPVMRTQRIAAKLSDARGRGISGELVVVAPVPPTQGSQQLATSGSG